MDHLPNLEARINNDSYTLAFKKDESNPLPFYGVDTSTKQIWIFNTYDIQLIQSYIQNAERQYKR